MAVWYWSGVATDANRRKALQNDLQSSSDAMHIVKRGFAGVCAS